MIRLKETILMLCFILSGALCYAHDEVGTENTKKVTYCCSSFHNLGTD